MKVRCKKIGERKGLQRESGMKVEGKEREREPGGGDDSDAIGVRLGAIPISAN